MIASLDPVTANGVEEQLLPLPEMCASGDVAEKRIRMFGLFQTDHGRESLAFECQLTEVAAVRREIGGQKSSARKQSFGFGQRLAGTKAQAL
jgi:hypothetical protein